VQKAGAALLSPRQLGFGVPGGADTAVRAARRYVDNMKSGQLLIVIIKDRLPECVQHYSQGRDFGSSRQTFSRAVVVRGVKLSTTGSPSCLQFGQFVLHLE
jgi:hypothetical protein